FGNADSKLASILLISAMEFGIAKNDEIEIQIPLTHKDIASLVGVTRETVSIELKKFDKKKYISYRKKKIVIKNKVELRKKAIF
ncbi:MAG: helix-turn-helix domain-containing protein, partial [Candidatus Levybacteria bacterium]|nr:helix-turn-helix domain-containing protein [Candidatus Levybacteria bacterium]